MKILKTKQFLSDFKSVSPEQRIFDCFILSAFSHEESDYTKALVTAAKSQKIAIDVSYPVVMLQIL